MVENVVRGRFTALTAGISRRQAQQESKRPIRERLAQMDLETKLSVFHPLYLRGRKFHLPENLLLGIEQGDPEAIRLATADSRVFVNAEPNPQLRALAEAWFTQALVV